MTEPYLIVGFRLSDQAGALPDTITEIAEDIEMVLKPTPIAALSMPDVFVVQLRPKSAFDVFEKVANILDKWDTALGNELQWFAHLADGDGCELASN